MVQPIDQPPSLEGSVDWIVRDSTLFSTTVVFALTGEVATLSNGSIANSRVMNGARSSPAILYVTMKFGLDTSYEKIQIFRDALALYMDARPREWSKLIRVSNSLIQSDYGYVQYLIVLQYTNNWQALDSIYHSRSQVRKIFQFILWQ